METRWADGRAHVAGANFTAGDYAILRFYTAMLTNPHLKNPAVSQALQPYVEAKPNVMRVINGIKSELQSTIDAIPAGWI